MDSLPAFIEREIPKLNEHQLRLLNQRIVERLKLMTKAKALNALSKFNLGDVVSFDHYDETIKGRITRINQKTVSVITEDDRHKWNVSPNFLTKEDHVSAGYSAEKEDMEEEAAIQELPIHESFSGRKTAKNAPCPCKSGKKYKRCCGKGEINSR